MTDFHVLGEDGRLRYFAVKRGNASVGLPATWIVAECQTPTQQYHEQSRTQKERMYIQLRYKSILN